jgi:hypothetical protein
VNVKGALEQLAADLSAPAVGLVAGLDPETLNPPCAWLQPREVRDYTLAGGGTLVVWVYLIAPNSDTPTVMARLDDMLEALLEVAAVSASDDVLDLASAVVLPTNPNAPLPAYRVAVDLDL